jgi:hypothetical protein
LRSGPTVVDSVFTPGVPQSGGGRFDLVSLADLKLELGLEEDATKNLYLAKTITRMSDAAQKFCDRKLTVQTYRQLVWPFRDPQPWQSPTHTDPLRLTYWPLASTPSAAGIAPPRAPVLNVASGGALAAARYYARISYVTAVDETAAGPEANVAVAPGQLLQVAAPGPDPAGLAIGWNVYLSTAGGGETLQNLTPIAVGNGWTGPTSGLVNLGPVPNHILVVEHASLPSLIDPTGKPRPLCEGVDFIADRETAALTRLFSDGYTRGWDMIPLEIIYSAGYAQMPDDIQDAVLQMCKARYYARDRDPTVRSQNVAGVFEQAFWSGAGPGVDTDMTPDVEAKLERHRMPVLA